MRSFLLSLAFISYLAFCGLSAMVDHAKVTVQLNAMKSANAIEVAL